MKYLYLSILSLFFLLQSCGSSEEPSLSKADDLVKVQALFEKNFSSYDGKITSAYFGTDRNRNNILDLITVNFSKDNKPYMSSYTQYTDVTESELKDNSVSSKIFEIKDVKLSALTDGLEKASALIIEKDKGFHSFCIRNAKYNKDENDNMIITFDIVAKHPSKSYFGKRVGISDNFDFSFKIDNKNNVIPTSGLTL